MLNRGPDVAVALIESRTQPEHFLVQRRSMDNKQYAGWLEFPGGKVENTGEFNGETSYEAVIREVQEETNLVVITANPLCSIEDTFPNGLTHLVHFFVVGQTQYYGSPVAVEGQPFAWLTLFQIFTYPRMLPLNRAAALILTTERHPDILE